MVAVDVLTRDFPSEIPPLPFNWNSRSCKIVLFFFDSPQVVKSKRHQLVKVSVNWQTFMTFAPICHRALSGGGGDRLMHLPRVSKGLFFRVDPLPRSCDCVLLHDQLAHGQRNWFSPERNAAKSKKNPKFSSYRESEINLELFDVVQKWPDDEVWRWRAGSILNWRRWPTFAERFDLAGSKLTGAIDFDFSFDWHVFRWIFLHFFIASA